MAKAKKGAPSKGLKSMTGFGSSLQEAAGVRIEVELKTVNSRYLDIFLRFPRAYSQLEMEAREVLGEYFSRGRIEVNVLRTPVSSEALSGGINRVVFDQLWKEQVAICKELQMDTPEVKAQILTGLFSRREVLDLESSAVDLELEKTIFEKALREAAQKNLDGRIFEGEKLKTDLLERLKTLEGLRDTIEGVHQGQPEEYQERLEQKVERVLKEVGTELDQGRVAAEVAMYVDKIDIAEELVRLKSHFEQFRTVVERVASGKKVGFLLQELLREFNTVASKAQNAEIQQLVVDARSEIERMREQAQNVE